MKDYTFCFGEESPLILSGISRTLRVPRSYRDLLSVVFLNLANGEFAHIPLTSASLSEKAGQLYVVVRPSSGKADKKVKLSTLGSTATHISPGLLSSHVDTAKRFFKEGTGAADYREPKSLAGVLMAGIDASMPAANRRYHDNRHASMQELPCQPLSELLATTRVGKVAQT